MYKCIPIKYSIFDETTNPIFGEDVTHFLIEDEAGGSYILLKQNENKIKLNIEELEVLYNEAKKAVKLYEENNDR